MLKTTQNSGTHTVDEGIKIPTLNVKCQGLWLNGVKLLWMAGQYEKPWRPPSLAVNVGLNFWTASMAVTPVFFAGPIPNEYYFGFNVFITMHF